MKKKKTIGKEKIRAMQQNNKNRAQATQKK